MNQQKFNEYMRLDLNIKNLEDNSRSKRNEQWKLTNEKLKLGHDIEKNQKKVIDLKKQQYGILGRAYVELEEDKEGNKG